MASEHSFFLSVRLYFFKYQALLNYILFMKDCFDYYWFGHALNKKEDGVIVARLFSGFQESFLLHAVLWSPCFNGWVFVICVIRSVLFSFAFVLLITLHSTYMCKKVFSLFVLGVVIYMILLLDCVLSDTSIFINGFFFFINLKSVTSCRFVNNWLLFVMEIQQFRFITEGVGPHLFCSFVCVLFIS